jgi:hypothetical protein
MMGSALIRKFIATSAVAVATLGGASVLGVQAAGAYSTGCTSAHVCVQVYGQQTFVSQVEVIEYKTTICDYQGRMIVYRSDGSKYEDRWSPFHSGCSHGAGWFDWYPKKYYPNNSRVCGLWYESHGVYRGAACETIHS